jgi:2'-5' RNA ligase
MAKERPKSPRARLFIALDLPEKLREGIVAWESSELDDPALRVVPRESLHITLAFLGYLPEREIERLREIVDGIRAPAPALKLSDPIAKPSLRRARLFALPVISPEAVGLQGELEKRLVAERFYKPEKQPFWPHVTVARVKSLGKENKQPMAVRRPPEKLSKSLLEPVFEGVRIALYRSELKPQGAQYTPLARVELF